MNSTSRLAAALAAAMLHLACAASVTSSDQGGGTTVTVVPEEARLPVGAQAPFAAVVTPAAISQAVTWSIQEGSPVGGTLTATATGVTYTAPASTGTFHVVATSVAAPQIAGSARVIVEAAGTNGDAPAWIAGLPTLSNGKKWNPGIPGGIPVGTVDTTLTTVTASTINAAISAASGRGSPTNLRVVEIPAGTYAISGTITPRNYVILRGAGAGGAGRTRLNFGSGGGVESNDTAWGSVPITTMALAAGETLPVGSTSVTVASATGFAVGDLIQLDQLDDLSYVWLYDAGYNKRAPFTDGPYHGPISPDGFRSVASVHQVTAVSGTTLTFDPPTRIAYSYFNNGGAGSTRLNPQVWRVSRRGTDGLWWFGLEKVSIAGPQTGAIKYHAGAFDWILDVETDGSSANGGITDDHVRFEHQFRSEIRRLYAHHTSGGPYSGGANYGVNLNAATSETLVVDSISVFMNKPMQTNCAGPGNVMAYNYVDNTSADGGNWMDGAINGSHQAFTHHLLVEGNWAANMGCDTTHGNSGYMAFLRNYSHGRSSTYANGNNLRAANTDAFQREMAFAGNVLSTVASGTRVYEATGPVSGGRYAIWSVGQNGDGGSGDAYDGQRTTPWPNQMSYSGTLWDGRTPTFTTKAAAKLWRHGNWDAVNGAIADWDAAFPAHQVASSWFLTAAPPFFGVNPWPWIDATGATAAARVGTLPAKARYDAGTPFAVP